MSTFQTMISLILLIFVLSVIVQAIQEVLKALLNTKATVMEQTIHQFMGDHLRLDQVRSALQARGLQIAALENFNKEDFRHLLDGVNFQDAQLKGLVVSAQSTADDIKDHIASSYEAARGAFLAAYTKRNKLFVAITSFIVVIMLNANLISLYDQISADFVVQQTLSGQAQRITLDPSKQGDLKEVYTKSREQISGAVAKYPILLRTSQMGDEFAGHPLQALIGLIVMGALVSLGAPFWNDVLKSLAGVNNALGTRQT